MDKKNTERLAAFVTGVLFGCVALLVLSLTVRVCAFILGM